MRSSRRWVGVAALAASVGCMPPLDSDPTVLAGPEHSASQLTVGGGYVHWISVEDSSLRRVPVRGGAVERVATSVHACAADAGDVYCAARGTGSPLGGDVVIRLRGSGATTLPGVVLSGEVTALLVRADALYGVAYRFREAAEVFVVPKAGGTPRTLFVTVEPGPIAVDDTHLYYAPASIQRVPLAGGVAETLHPGFIPYPTSTLAVTRDRVVFVSRASLTATWPSVWSVPKTGGAALEIARPHQQGTSAHGPFARALLGVGDRVWFSSDEGGLWWVPADGSGSPVQRAGKYKEPSFNGGYIPRPPSIALADGQLFWNTERGAVLALAP